MFNQIFIENLIRKRFDNELLERYALRLFHGINGVKNKTQLLSSNELNKIINDVKLQEKDFWIIVLNLTRLQIPIFEMIFWYNSNGHEIKIKDKSTIYKILEQKEIEDPITGEIVNADFYMEKMVLLFKINDILFNNLHR